MWQETRRGFWGISGAVVVLLGVIGAPASAAGCDAPEARSHVTAAETHLAAGRYRDAIGEFNRAILAAPDCDRAKQGIIEANRALLERRGGLDESRTAATRHISLGGVAFDAGDYARAIAEWEAALALEPDNRVATALIASAREAQVDQLIEEGSRRFAAGDTVAALTAWQRAQTIDPFNQTVRDLLIEGQSQQARTDEAELEDELENSMRRIRLELERNRNLPLADMDGAGMRYVDVSERPTEPVRFIEGARADIMAELRNPVSLDFEDTDLRAVLRFLSEVTGINFLVQEEVFEDLGEIDPDDEDAEPQIKITIFVNELPLESALKGMLRQHNLDFSVERDFLYVSTPDVLRASSFEQLEVRYYRLRDTARLALPKLGTQGSQASGAIGETQIVAIASGNLIQRLSEIPPANVGDSPASPIDFSVLRLMSLIRNFVPEVVEATIKGGQQRVAARVADTSVGGWSRITNTTTFILAEHVLRERKWDASGREILSRLEYDALTHTLIVKNTPSNLAIVERMLEQLDKPTKQVVIESRFLRVGMQDIQRVDTDLSILGLTRSNFLRPGNLVFGELGAVGAALGNPLSLGGLFTAGDFGNEAGKAIRLGFSNNDTEFVSAAVELLTQLDNTEIVSAPRITTLSGKPAVIQDIRTTTLLTDVDVTTTIVQPPAGAAANPIVIPEIENTFSAISTGVTLIVTPLVLDDNTIRLVLLPDVSTLGLGNIFPFQFVTFDANAQPITLTIDISLPEVFRQSLYTNVTVNDGDTLVLGGMVNNEVTFQERSVPFFRDLPLLGNFFRSTGETIRRDQLLIFIKCNIISPAGISYARLK